MTTHTYRILIGAAGWLHPAWQSRFYPDDLPDDWQLGYYSAEFPVVLMPAVYWQTPLETIRDWLEDSSDSLGIICEVPPQILLLPEAEASAAFNKFVEGLSILGTHCLGLLLSVTGQGTDIAKLIKQTALPVPLCLEFTPAVAAETVKTIQKMCEQHHIGLCWRGEGSVEGLSYGPLALTKIDSRGMDMRQLRQVVETILETTIVQQTSVLIIEGEPPDLEAVRNANVILDLF